MIYYCSDGCFVEYFVTDAFDTVDMEDSDDSSEQSDLGSDDGYIETDSSGEEMEGEGEGEAESEGEAAASASDSASHTYVPPHLREEKRSKNLEKLRKTVQGLINR